MRGTPIKLLHSLVISKLLKMLRDQTARGAWSVNSIYVYIVYAIAYSLSLRNMELLAVSKILPVGLNSFSGGFD